ncbi:ComEA family DNA-binding protein [Luteimonas sp. BDR2-5]|nr:ComEA family DNA-binding protein [Luteimonas sp. BDR2-5]MCD9029251.1 ComEA family DNA-binding protein [Luteimonas sp. BDR2-5]
MTSFKSIFASLVLSLLLAGSAFASDKVNINTADAETLARVLHNVGQAKAEAIVAYRDENGPFRSAEQLAMVKGIGLRTVENNRERIELDVAASRPRVAEQRRPAAGTVATRAAQQQ